MSRRGADDGYDLETLAPIEDSLPPSPPREVSFHLPRRWVGGAAVVLIASVIVGISIWTHSGSSPRNTDAEMLTTPTTIAIGTLVRRCEAISTRIAPDTTGIGTSDIDAASARRELDLARERIPAWLATLDGSNVLAQCDFDAARHSSRPPATTMCPNGDIVSVDLSPPAITYAVDAHLDLVRLPGLKYLRTAGRTTPPTSGPCVGLEASGRAP